MPRHIVQVRFNIPQGFRNITNNNTDARYIFGRNQLYRIAFMRFTLVYARVFPETLRRILEFILLIAALFSFLSLIYIHVVFVHLPVTCLERYQKEWEGAKILRVELLRKNGNSNYSLYDSYYKEHANRLLEAGLKPCPKVQYLQNDFNNDSLELGSEERSNYEESLDITDLLKCKLNESNDGKGFLDKVAEEIHAAFSMQPPEELNIIEYSLEYGFLRLSPAMRKSLNLTVLFVALDPNEDTCFGGVFHKFLLDQFLGYDELLISSVRHLAERSNYKGYVRNVGKEIEYIFVNDNGWLHSYLIAAVIMPVTTFSVSLLLRFAHQQMFLACTNMFELIRFQGHRRYNGSPLFTVILALFGMMAIITSFFHNSTLTLNITFIIWLADFYDSICCRALISKRHWYRFFLLYHYVFYAYNHRFNGLHWQLNLVTSWLFILHSMVFFFHHYELPYYVQSFVQFRETHVIRPPRHHPVTERTLSRPDESTEPLSAQPTEQIIIDHQVVPNTEDHTIPNPESVVETLADASQAEGSQSLNESSDDTSHDIPTEDDCLKCKLDERYSEPESCSKEETGDCSDDKDHKCLEKCVAPKSSSSQSGDSASLCAPSHSELPNEHEEQSSFDSEQNKLIKPSNFSTESGGQNETEKTALDAGINYSTGSVAELEEKPAESSESNNC